MDVFTRQRRRHALGAGIRSQLILSTAVPVTILLAALSVVMLFGITQVQQRLVEDRDSELVLLASRQVASHIADSVLLLTQIASLEPVRNSDPEGIRDILGVSMTLTDRFDRISVTNADGRVIASTAEDDDRDYGGLDFLAQARRLRRPVRSPLLRGEGETIVVAAVPVYGSLGQFSGCILGVWDLSGSRLGHAVDMVRVGDSGFAFLIDSDGVILYHPNAELGGYQLSAHPAVEALQRGEQGAQTVRLASGTTVMGYAPVPLGELRSSLFADPSWNGWALVTHEAWENVMGPTRSFLLLMGLILVLVVMAPLAVLAITSRKITAPLRSLVQQADDVATGEFDTHVSIKGGPSEVQELVQAFNKMVDHLALYRSDTENYVASVLSSQERERKRVARELHDDTAQALIVLGRHIEMAQEEAREPALAQELEEIRDMVDLTLEGVRRFTSDLRPPLLEELGLPRTLHLLGDRVSREESTEVSVDIIGEPIPLSPELELGLYRLAQEALSNVRRHAQASHASIKLIYGVDRVRLQVADDGVGFAAPATPADLVKSGGLGLMGMHERARLFGGRATITSEPGQGTTVSIIVPLGAAQRTFEPDALTEDMDWVETRR